MTAESEARTLFSQVVHLHFATCFKQIEHLGVHPGQIPMFMLLNKEPGLSQKQIADQLCVKPPTVAVALKRMEKAGFVERKPDQIDQRVTRIYSTEYGKQVSNEVNSMMKTMETKLFQGFSEEEIILIKRFFLQMRDNLKEVKMSNESGFTFHDICSDTNKKTERNKTC